MGIDLALNENFDLYLDAQGDLASTEGLDTAVKVSVLSHIRVTAAEEPIPERRRGWIGNAPEIIQGAELGSRLWLLEQRKNLEEHASEAEDYMNQSLEWMVDSGVCSRVEPVISTSLTGLDGTVKIVSNDNRIETVMFKALKATQ